MTDLDEGLLTGKGKKQSKQYRKRFDECELRVKTLRNKNNQLQKQRDNDIEGDIRAAIRQQATFIQIQITEIKKMIAALSKDYHDPPSKNKIKELLNMSGKEIQRNKIIMQDFVNRASSTSSFLKRQSSNIRKSKTQFQEYREQYKQIPPVIRQNSSFLQSQDFTGEILIQQKIIQQKNALLKQLQQKNLAINKIMGQMGQLVCGQQKDMIDQIGAHIEVSHENVVQTNEQLTDAISYQKKAKKKYICLVAVILFILLAAAGLLIFLLKDLV